MWEPVKFLELSLQSNWWRIPRKHLKPQLLKKQENPDMHSPTLKSRWFPSCQLLVIPRKNNNKGTKSSFCALPWSCSSLQSSTFGLSSSVPLINQWGGAGRGQLWLPHPLPSPALLAPLLLHGVTLQVPGSSSTKRLIPGSSGLKYNELFWFYFFNFQKQLQDLKIFLITRRN